MTVNGQHAVNDCSVQAVMTARGSRRALGVTLVTDVARTPEELQLEAILRRARVRFTRPECEPRDPANMDFKITDLGLYIECKKRKPGRLREQIKRVPRATSIICLIGPDAARDLYRLALYLAIGAGGRP